MLFGLLLFAVVAPVRAQQDPDKTALKLSRITELLLNEAYATVPQSDLSQAGSDELRRELERRGRDTSYLSPRQPLADQLATACRKNPDLCAPNEVLLGACVSGMTLNLGDPYAAYLSPTAFRSLMARMGGQEQGGPGVAVIKDHPGQPIQVLESESGTAAAEAGLNEGDEVLEIDGQSTSPLAIDEARARLAGAPGTVVELTIQRANRGSAQHIRLTRAAIDGRTVRTRLISQRGSKVGYLKIRSFGARTADELQQALSQLKQDGVTGLVLDLRNNGGGLVNAAVGVCSCFLPEGARVVTVNQRSRTDVQVAWAGPRAGLPLAVLINENSASSAEITAGAIRDARLGTLVGTRSFGKGTVQRFLPLSDGSALKVTTAHYRTPRGAEINGVGIAPDILVSSSKQPVGDPQLMRALETVIQTGESPTALGPSRDE